MLNIIIKGGADQVSVESTLVLYIKLLLVARESVTFVRSWGVNTYLF